MVNTYRLNRPLRYADDYFDFDDWFTDSIDDVVDELLENFGDFDEFLTANQLSRAVDRNQYWATQLGWQQHYDAIVRLLASASCLQPNFTPGWENLSKAVACWQQRQGLAADGILGQDTWRRMQSALGAPFIPGRGTPSQPDLGRPEWIEWQPSPYHSPRRNRPITTVILHFTAGPSLENTVRWFQNNPSNVSAHYVVGKDGRIVQMVSLDRVAHHAAGAIRSSIGIEIVNWGWLLPRGQRIPGTQNRCPHPFCSWRGQPYNGPQPIRAWNRYWEPFTSAQYSALGRLLQYVTNQIPTINQIIGHKDVSQAGKLDPGGAFDWDRIRTALRPNFTGHIGFLSRS